MALSLRKVGSFSDWWFPLLCQGGSLETSLDLHLGVSTWVWRENDIDNKHPISKYLEALEGQCGFSEPVFLESGRDTTCFSPEGGSLFL